MTSDTDTTTKRKRYGGRPVYTRGPVIWTLRLLSASSALCAIVALYFSLSSQNSNITAHHREQVSAERAQVRADREIRSEQINADRAIQASRQRSARDNCELIRGIIIATATQQNTARVRRFITATPLRDCLKYSIRVTSLPLPGGGP